MAAVNISKSRPSIAEITIAASNVFQEVILPDDRFSALYSVYCTAEMYYCYTGPDGGTRVAEARVMLPAGQWLELDRERHASLFFASSAGGTLHFKGADRPA